MVINGMMLLPQEADHYCSPPMQTSVPGGRRACVHVVLELYGAHGIAAKRRTFPSSHPSNCCCGAALFAARCCCLTAGRLEARVHVWITPLLLISKSSYSRDKLDFYHSIISRGLPHLAACKSLMKVCWFPLISGGFGYI